ncbi:MAG TPA: hypothetical protein VLN44_05400 [Pyrinomonadaceae bacterium]|nr:hypothetical protein [Pyrinomonadaceae bacterium]
MITGYNTDVEFDGVVYHVQTEDKGLDTPVILSLVYSGGAILASKRSPYDDLVARGFDEKVLAARLQRQHKLICAAVHAGRIEELKQLAVRNSAPATVKVKSDVVEDSSIEEEAPRDEVIKNEPQVDNEIAGDRFSISGDAAHEGGLTLMLSGGQELRGGRTVTLRVNVLRRGPNGKERVPGAKVTVKTLGSDFPPQFTYATTDGRGAVVVLISLPDFKTGRAAILIQAEAGGEVAQLRKIILPARA